MKILRRTLATFHLALAVALVLGLTTTRTAGAQDPVPPPTVEAAQADVTPPVITEPLDLLAAAADPSGAVVVFDVPVAVDDVDGPVAVACTWGSGALFPLGTTVVTCNATDLAGNAAMVELLITVSDQTPPVITWPADVFVSAPDASGGAVPYAIPFASDNVDAAVAVTCDPGPGFSFPVGTSTVTCWASDSSGNAAAVVSFSIVVEAPPPPVAPSEPLPTDPPTEPEPPEVPADPVAPEPGTGAGDGSDGVDDIPGGEGASPDETPTSTVTVTPQPTAATVTPEATVTTAATQTPVPDALALPLPYPGSFTINYYGGPLNGIDLIWGYQEFPVSQEFGHTEFSIMNHSWYTYGTAYGLDGFQHPGLDIGMPAGTWLYSPVEGTVRIAGGVPGYTFYGNWEPGVGQLMIVTDQGDEIVLGHMGGIAVGVGERVSVGQFVGVSGGFNGDHLHLEVREVRSGGWLAAVDPRQSVIVQHIEAAGSPADPEPEEIPAPAAESANEVDLSSSVALHVPDLAPVSEAVLLERQSGVLFAILQDPLE